MREFASIPALAGNPARAGERHLRHGRRLDGERHQVFRLQIMHMVLAAGARDGLRLERHHLQVIGEPAPGELGIETLGEFRILGRDAGRIPALMPVIIGACRRAELLRDGIFE